MAWTVRTRANSRTDLSKLDNIAFASVGAALTSRLPASLAAGVTATPSTVSWLVFVSDCGSEIDGMHFRILDRKNSCEHVSFEFS